MQQLKARGSGADKASRRPQGTSIPLEVRRRLAVALLETGWSVRKVTRHVKAAPSSVRRWCDAVAHAPETGLTAIPHSGGSQPKLHSAHARRLIELLSQGARTHGFRNALWALARVATSLSATPASPIVPPASGMSCGAWDGALRNPLNGLVSAIKRPWRPGPINSGRYTKKAQREGCPLVFLDETCCMRQPTVHSPWAPQGSPIHHRGDRHDRLSVIGAIIVSPIQKRLGCYFSMSPAYVTGNPLLTFVQQLHGPLKHPLLVM